MSRTEAKPPQSVAEIGPAVETLDIELTFDVGRIQVPVAQLRTLQSGYLFELETDLDTPVTILANGRPIGKGRLVQIGERVGVQTAEMEQNGS